MMKLYIKQKILSLTDTFDIYDENHNKKYFAKCDFTILLHQLKLYQGNVQIGYVKEHFKLLEPAFSFYLNDELLGKIVKEVTLFRPKYHLDFNDWRIEGDFFGLDYEVYDSKGNIIMSFYKELFAFSDCYCLDIKDPRNEKLCLLIALAVDLAICTQKD